MQTCTVLRLGRVDYEDAWAFQKDLAQARATGTCPDHLLLLEHPHTYTLGSSFHQDNLLMTPAQLAAHQITVLAVDRGGDITYHGPGQVVGYPILELATHPQTLRADVVAYVRQLEAVLILALEKFGLQSQRLAGYSGVWLKVGTALQKIAAIGVKVSSRRVTYHGFALNVNTDLAYFNGIVPCGIEDKAVTSMAAVLGHFVDIESVQNAIIEAFGQVFERQMQLGTLDLAKLSIG